MNTSAPIASLDELAAWFGLDPVRRSPPPPGWNPPPGGAIDMRIGRDGTWYYLGSPIQRPAMVRLFARVLRREADGGYALVTPVERLRIQVDDVPFVAVELARRGEGKDAILAFRTNLDDVVAAGPDHALIVRPGPGGAEPAPYIGVRAGLDALLARPVYYELAEIAQTGPPGPGGEMGVWSGGCFFALGAAHE
jgi:uncharacterized protein